MSARLHELAKQRAALVAQSDQNRAALGAAFDAVEERLWIVERIAGVARRVHQFRSIVGAVAVALVLLPRSARPRLRRAVQVLPLVIELVRAFWSRRQRRAAAADSPAD